MALSDKEKQVLDELERQLGGAKAKKTEPEAVRPLHFARLLVLGSLLFVIGLSVMIFATSIHQIWLGLLAFLIMLAGLYLVSQNWSAKAIKAGKPGPKTGKAGENFFQKRWDERNRGK